MDVNYAYYNTAKGYRIVGGTAAQFLKADGSTDNRAYVDKTGDSMNGTLTFNHAVSSTIKKDLSAITSASGFARDILQLTGSNGVIDVIGWRGGVDSSGNVTFGYGYLGGTGYNTANALRWNSNQQVVIGGNFTPTGNYQLEVAGNSLSRGSVNAWGTFNTTAGELQVQRLGVNRIRTNPNSTIISGDQSNGIIYLRPQGDSTTAGQIMINANTTQFLDGYNLYFGNQSAQGAGSALFHTNLPNATTGYGLWLGHNLNFNGTDFIQPRGNAASYGISVNNAKGFSFNFAASNGTSGGVVNLTEVAKISALGTITTLNDGDSVGWNRALNSGFLYRSLLGTVDLNTVLISGHYVQTANANATPVNNYPIANAGVLKVFGSGTTHVEQQYTTYVGNRVFTRYLYNNGNWSNWSAMLTDNFNQDINSVKNFAFLQKFQEGTKYFDGNANAAFINKYENKSVYAPAVNSATGNVKITFPTTMAGVMWSLKVKIIQYVGSTSNTKTFQLPMVLNITGYNSSVGSVNVNFGASGNNFHTNFTGVRTGLDASNNKVVWLDFNSVLSYPKVIIEEILVHHNGSASALLDGAYAIDITTDETGYTHQTNLLLSDFKELVNESSISDWNSKFPTNHTKGVASSVFSDDLLAVSTGTYSASTSTSAVNKPFTNVGGLISFGQTDISTRILGARDNSDNLWFQSGSGTGNWRQLASREWVNGQIPSIPTNFITTNTSQTALAGDKTTSGNWIFNGTGATGLTLLRPGQTINNSVALGFDTVSHYAGLADSDIYAIGTSANLALANRKFWVSNSLSTANLPGQVGGSNLSSRDVGGYSIATTTNTNRAEMILRHNWSANNKTFAIGGTSNAASGSMGQWGMYRWLNDRTVNGNDGFFGWVGDNDTLSATSLAGTGTRMVVADPSGIISTQNIPSSVDAYTKVEALNLFVGKSGAETIADTKTFTHSPVIPNASQNSHAVNLSQLNSVASHPNINYLNSINQFLGTGANPYFSDIKLMNILGYGRLALAENIVGNELGLVDIDNNQFYVGRYKGYIKAFSSVYDFEGINFSIQNKNIGVGQEATNEKLEVNGRVKSAGFVHKHYSAPNLLLDSTGGVFDISTLNTVNRQYRKIADGSVYPVDLGGNLTVFVLEDGNMDGTTILLPSKASVGQEVQIFNDSPYVAVVQQFGGSNSLKISPRVMMRFTFVLDGGDSIGGSGTGKWKTADTFVNSLTL